MAKKLYINFLWHMHQPYYRKRKTDKTLMPWVRMHAIKSYYDMPKIVEKHAETKVNFNIVPSLLKQINEYTMGKEDDYLIFSRIPPSDLTNRQKKFIKENFFQAQFDKMINPYHRYRELNDKHLEEYSNQDFLDLQVWFNLTWFGQWFKDNHTFVKDLIKKGKNFSELEKNQLLDLQLNILKDIKNIYLNLLKQKKIELSTTPFYHPILPLLLDSNAAHECMPHAELPEESFKYQEDAQWHVKKAIKMHLETFKEKPKGIWPAEGAVSNETLDLFIKNELKWTASDEDILRNSIDKWDENSLYQPYLYSNNSGEIAIVFRNHELSDLIGFVYQKWHYEDAVNDFISRLRDIKQKITCEKGLVSIIMDGENAWEYYSNNGLNFLSSLYEEIANEENLELVTINDYLTEFPPKNNIKTIFPGSWINASYDTWIGDSVKNRAWEMLLKTRNILSNEKCNIPESMYVAEGSDWFWWYGDLHSSVNDIVFDELFCDNLHETCKNTGIIKSDFLVHSLYDNKKDKKCPLDIISPEINGKEDDYFEWQHGIMYEMNTGYGTMQRVSLLITEFIYGFDFHSLYLRWNFENYEDIKEIILTTILKTNKSKKIIIKIDFKNKEGVIWFDGENKLMLKRDYHWAFKNIIELMIPLELIKFEEANNIELKWTVRKNENNLEEWPRNGYLELFPPEKVKKRKAL